MGFLDKLDYREIGEVAGKTIYKLNSTLVYISPSIGRIVIPEGFETDLASVPRVPIIYMMWGGRAHREAVLHDYLYRIGAIPAVSFECANDTFKEAMINRGQPFYIYHPTWLGVTLGGKWSYHRMRVMDNFDLDIRY